VLCTVHEAISPQLKNTDVSATEQECPLTFTNNTENATIQITTNIQDINI